MAKLDGELQALLIQKDFFAKNPSAGRPQGGAEDPLYISVKFSGDIAALKEAGFQVGSVGKVVAHGMTNLAGLEALANLPQVESIELQRDRHTVLNRSVPDIKANQVWGRSGDYFSGYTGRGVIVGIVDTGIDFKHQNFRDADAEGTTRILAIWDQTLTAQGGETAPGPITNTNIADEATPLGYGVEYDTQQIDDTLQNSNPTVPVRHIDADGHGTHVAGIAAGNGSQRGGCLTAYEYVGVAPEADIIVVRMFGLTASDKKLTRPSSSSFLLDAIRYILNQAANLNQPAVINLSLGLLTEQMDGTSHECQEVDKLLVNNTTGRAIVFAAGNDAAMNFHASGTVPAGSANSLALNFTILPKDTARGTRSLVVLYNGSNLQAQLTSQVPGTNGIVSWVSSGASGNSTTANGPGGTVTVTNQPNSIWIVIKAAPVTPAQTPPVYNPMVSGTWKLELRDTGASATSVDVYCLYGSSHDPQSPYFLSNTTSRSTLSEDATGHESLAVGSYKVGGELSSYSGRGPTLDAAARTKPELCAPGENITSARSSTGIYDRACALCCCACCGAYVDLDGTSMAAPHITGVIALMLHKDPNLKHDEITTFLKNNADPKPGDSTPADDLGWGAGKTDALSTVNAEPQFNPPIAAASAVAHEAPLDAVAAVRDQFLATERGPEFKLLVEKHFAEVRDLVNTNRRVATVWHRCRGPTWARLSLRALYSPELPMPMSAGDITLKEAIRRFGDVLLRYASPSFCSDLKRFLPELDAITEGMSLTALIRLLSNGRAA